MKIVITTVLAFVAILIGAVAYAPAPACAGTCMGIPPMCPIGQRPVCLCDQNHGTTCRWVCG